MVGLFAERAPIQLHEGMFFRDFADDFVGDARAFTQTCQMQLLHFAVVTHIVHEVERIPFSPNESHDSTSGLRNLPRSVFSFHYAVNYKTLSIPKSCI